MTLRTRWTPAEEARCLKLWREGKSNSAIAQALNRGESSVKLRTRGIARDRGYRAEARAFWTEAEDGMVDAMRAEGKSGSEIAKRIGRPVGSVWARLHHRRKLAEKNNPAPEPAPAPKPVAVAVWVPPKPRQHQWTPDQDARLRSYMADGIGIGGAASLLRIPRDQVVTRWAKLQAEQVEA